MKVRRILEMLDNCDPDAEIDFGVGGDKELVMITQVIDYESGPPYTVRVVDMQGNSKNMTERETIEKQIAVFVWE